MPQHSDHTEPELDAETVPRSLPAAGPLARGSRSRHAVRDPRPSWLERLRGMVIAWFDRDDRTTERASQRVSITSRPSNATVALVTDGIVTPLGTTPLVAHIDPARNHDLVVAKRYHTTEIRRLAPASTHHVVVVLRAR